MRRALPGLVVLWLVGACGGASPARPRLRARPRAPAPATEPEPAAEAPPGRPPSPEALAEAAHVLDRFAFGPRAGEVERVARMGTRAWIDRQLTPEVIDDEAGRAAVAPYRLALERPHALFEWYRNGLQQPDTRPGQLRHQIQTQLQLGTLARHVESERELFEVLVDFWTNHFNITSRKGVDLYLAADYVERAIRPHVLGRFEDLLVATARHPAMLFYLDQAESIAPGSRPWHPGGLNENYARELLELHTVGVDGGYTQDDVIAVARILTGWGMSNPRCQAGFLFSPRFHDQGPKQVMGRDFPAGGGEEEGMTLLHFLAHHPSTARFLATKLLRRFVADDPPPECVEQVARAYLDADTDLTATVRAVVECSALWSHDSYGAKVKSPLELVASAIRALGGHLDGESGPERAVAALGQPLFGEPVPTGYPEVAAEWLGPGAMLQRIETMKRFAAGVVPGVTVDLDALVPLGGTATDVADGVADRVLSGRCRPETRRALRDAVADLDDLDEARRIAVALALSSPEFQHQ